MTRREEIWLFIRAQAVAFLAVGVDWLMVALVVFWGASLPHLPNYLLAGVSGNVAGAITEFVIKRYFVFGAEHDRFVAQARRYIVVSLGAALINAGVSRLVIGGLHLPTLPWIYITSTVSGLLWTYPMHRYYVFPKLGATARHPAPGALGIDKLTKTRASP